MHRLVFVLLILFTCSFAQTVHIGILSFRPTEITKEQYKPLAEYLKRELSQYDFVLEPLSFIELENKMNAQSIDFLLTNPASYIYWREKKLLSPAIASLIELQNGKKMSQFAGVIFSDSSNEKIKTLADIKGARVATVGTDSLGGFLMQAYELQQIGIDVRKESKLVFTGMPHDNTIYEVLTRRADIGFARTSVVEKMIAEGKINAKNLRILNPQQSGDFPFLRSTALYPQWALAPLVHTNLQISTDLGIALLQMPSIPDIGGFSTALDYDAVAHLLEQLHVAPFDIKEPITLAGFVQAYLTEFIIFGFVLFCSLGFGIFFLLRYNTALRAQQQSLSLYKKVFKNSQEAIAITAPDTSFIKINPAFCSITGYSRDEIIGGKPSLLKSGLHQADFYAKMWEDLLKDGCWEGNIYNRRKNGEIYIEFLHISALVDANGTVEKYVAIFSDVTKAKHYEAELQKIAHYDTLTMLPNQRSLRESLEKLMKASDKNGKGFTLFFINIDAFNTINERYGFDIGDKVLIDYAKKLQSIFKRTDTIARIGGDEFAVVLSSVDAEQTCHDILDRILCESTHTFTVADINISLSVSIGVTSYPQDRQISAEKCIRQADQAMYQAKLAGKNQYKFYDTNTETNLQSKLVELEHFAQALRANQFVVYYQPKVDMKAGKLLGFEALIRWNDPQRGILAPFAFLPLIERHPLMIELGEFVIIESLQMLELWQKEIDAKLHVSVNLSASQIIHPDFMPRLLEILKSFDTTTVQALEFEVLETSALEDIKTAEKVINACKKLGISFSLDDFGTGYSSLTYLKKLDIATLKIDQSFVRELFGDPENLMILQAIIALAKSFEIDVIAEGVEDIEIGNILLALGCKWAQGYVIAKPMPCTQVIEWSKNWQAPKEWLQSNQTQSVNLPLLYGIIAHEHWMRNLLSVLIDNTDTTIQADHTKCDFIKLSKKHDIFKNLTQEQRDSIYAKHEQVHSKAQKLLKMHNQGKIEALQLQIPELKKLSKQFKAEIAIGRGQV